MTLLQKGTLRDHLLRTTERALASGVLLPIPTDHAVINDQGVRFLVRVLAGLRRKDEARKEQSKAERAGLKVNPFLPPETDLVVSDVTDSHIAVLNKFNVVEHHLLIITRRFEHQETLLTVRDFEALWVCMAEYDGLGFYNGGPEGGASQEHKHLQFVPLPLDPQGPAVPMEPLLRDAVIDRDGIGSIPAFSFKHAFSWIDRSLWQDAREAAERSYDLYGHLLGRVGIEPPVPGELTRQSLPYCMIVTRTWMLLVPRSREHVEGISLNSLAYAGSFFVRDKEQLEVLRSTGPLRALADAGFPK
ncbi:MAG: phosphorylase [Nitrospirota bacterium]|nr:phosphorylase [Nitrospirota bacterium]